jgi:lipoate-protein ligase A
MHGEYKTPGGKLVVVDLEVTDGRLVDVQVSGDFFLYPEEALAPITAALEGLAADLDAAAIAEAVERAVPPGAELFGFSSEAVAIAVRRAVESGAES